MPEDETEATQQQLADGTIVNQQGKITIAEDVITAVAASSASQVEGLGEKKSNVTEDISRIFGSRRKGVTIELEENEVSIALRIAVKYGYPVHEVAKKAQETIGNEVKKNTGLDVKKVDIYVNKLQMPEEKRESPEQNIEE